MPKDTPAGRSKEPALPSGLLSLDEIKGETETKWLWPGKIPIGHVTIMAGEASSGKSLLAAEIAAQACGGNTSGPMPAGREGPMREGPMREGPMREGPMREGPMREGSVLYAQANQHENLVLKRRLLAAGVDASRVQVVNPDAFQPGHRDASGDRGSSDIPPAYMLEGALMSVRDASLIVIDDLHGWLDKTRLKPEELTEVFKRLATMAARCRVAVVVLWRLEKAGRAAQTRQLDALSAAAPVVWLLAGDTYGAQTRLAVCAQNRLGAQAENLAFAVEGDRLVWRQAARQVSADDVLAARTADRPERRQAGRWLLELLAQGPITAKELLGEARACGLAERTVRRAAGELDLHPVKDGKRKVWVWGVRAPAAAGSGESAPVAAREGSEVKIQGSGSTLCSAIAEASQVNAGGDAAAQNVAVLPEEARRSEENQAAPVIEQKVAVLPEVGNLAQAEEGRDNRDDYPTEVGSLADSAVVQKEPGRDALLDVAEQVCLDAASDPEEEQERANLLAAVLASDGGETKEQAAAAAKRERRQQRRDRRIIERTLAICRGD